jgi:hypothetical protein
LADEVGSLAGLLIGKWIGVAGGDKGLRHRIDGGFARGGNKELVSFRGI